MSKRLLVYLAGPYTPQEGGGIDQQIRELERNLRRAVEVAEEVLLRGHIPFIPHTHTSGFGMRTNLPQDPDLYYYWDREILRRCDAVLYYGRSFGADREWRWAKELGLLRVEDARELPLVLPPLILEKHGRPRKAAKEERCHNEPHREAQE